MKKDVKQAMARARIPDCSGGPMSLAMDDRRTLAAEIERLQAIVAKLPKTKDGVYVVPTRDRVWFIERGYKTAMQYEIYWDGDDWRVATHCGERPLVADCFSTRAAAEAAEGE